MHKNWGFFIVFLGVAGTDRELRADLTAGMLESGTFVFQEAEILIYLTT